MATHEISSRDVVYDRSKVHVEQKQSPRRISRAVQNEAGFRNVVDVIIIAELPGLLPTIGGRRRGEASVWEAKQRPDGQDQKEHSDPTKV